VAVSSDNGGPPARVRSGGEEQPKATLQGVMRALRVLELLAERPMRATDAAEALQMSWATLHRTLSQLESSEFITRDSAGVFRMGRRTWLLGSTYLVGHPLLELAIPLFGSAAEETPSGVYQLAERSGNLVVTLYVRDALSGETITRTTYGHHFPMHCGSKGLVLLASLPPAEIDKYLAGPLARLTPETDTDPESIRAKLETIRQQGYSRTVGDVQSFTGSLAAPVHNSVGEVVACVCLVMARTQFDEGPAEAVALQSVQRVARTISLGTGWQPMHWVTYDGDRPS
jgi:DNA-binding IclR family transcriptional regulator